MSIWSRTLEMAEKTPPERNRYVDFLRAVSILMVVTGHWLVAAPWYQDGTLFAGDLLELRPRTQWMTWLFQVMPIFFIAQRVTDLRPGLYVLVRHPSHAQSLRESMKSSYLWKEPENLPTGVSLYLLDPADTTSDARMVSCHQVGGISRKLTQLFLV